jgi:amidase
LHGTIRSEEDLYHEVDPDHVNDAVGPIFVEGCAPHNVLEVEILDIALPSKQGYVLVIPGFGLLRQHVSSPVTRICRIDEGEIDFRGLRIRTRPCIGTIGVAPASGSVGTLYPGDHGGNLDTTDIRAGSRVYFPVFVEGALLAMGDGKAVMGDGEVCGTGVGVPLVVTARLRAVRGWSLARPLIHVNGEWMSVASAPTLEEACQIACLDLVRLVERCLGLPFVEAYMLTSLTGHLRISQVVDPLMTVRMSLPTEYLPGLLGSSD